MQIAAALVIRPVINCNICLTQRWRERYRKTQGDGAKRVREEKRQMTGERQVAKEQKYWVRKRVENGERRDEGKKNNLVAQRNSWQHRRCKTMDFLPIIPPLLRFNYPLPELSVRLQVWPHTEKAFASNQTAWPFNPSAPLQSWHGISGLSGASHHGALCCSSGPQGANALHYINHSDIVITAVLPWFSMQIPGFGSLI